MFFAQHEGRGTIDITFRVGAADEPLPLRGATHLIEHLTMFGWSEELHDCNAHITLNFCTFTANGEPDELARFAAGVSKALANLPLDRLDDERRVLRIEAETSSFGYPERLLFLRHGLRGAGRANAPEMALNRADTGFLKTWLDDWFNRSNAVITVSGPELPELDFELPDGARRPLFESAPLVGIEFPAYVADDPGGFALGAVARRGPATFLAAEIFEDELRRILRKERALVYDVGSGLERIGFAATHLAIGAEVRRSESVEAVSETIALLHRLAANGPDDELLARTKTSWMRGFTESNERHATDLRAAAVAELLGDTDTPTAWSNAVENLTREDTQEAFQAFADTLLVIAPETDPPPVGLPEAGRLAPTITGTRFKGKTLSSLVAFEIGKEGIKWETVDGDAAIAADEIELAIVSPTGRVDLVGVDETLISFDPTDLRQPEEAKAALAPLIDSVSVEIEDAGGVEIERLADEKLTRRWTVDDELKQAAALLGEGDDLPLNLAEATVGMKGGLVVLTERRLIWIYEGFKKRELREFQRNRISEVRAKGMRKDSIEITHDGETVKFKELRPRERAAEFLAALSD